MSNNILNIFNITDSVDLPEAVRKVLDMPLSHRDSIYDSLANTYENDFSYDWFQSIYESELAQRNQNKQDFTPNVVGILLSMLTGTAEGLIYEPTAGNGSLIIANWQYRVNSRGGHFDAEKHPVSCWELSSRSIPLLLLNLSIRGIVGTANHGNVLTKEITTTYTLSKSCDSKYSIIKKEIKS